MADQTGLDPDTVIVRPFADLPELSTLTSAGGVPRGIAIADGAVSRLPAYSLDASWYGLSESNTAAQNTTALGEANTAWAAIPGAELVVPPGDYDINSVSLSPPAGATLTMLGTFVYDGAGVALSIGSSGTPVNRLRAFGIKVSSSAIDVSVGRVALDLVNLYESEIEVRLVENHRVGVRARGDNGAGFVYNQVRFGQVVDNKFGLELRATSIGATDITDAAEVGWSNENIYTGGRFHWTSSFGDEDGAYHIVALSGPSSVLTADASASATTITVEDATEYAMLSTPFDLDLQSFEDGESETVSVTSIATNTLTLASGLTYAHDAGTFATVEGYENNNIRIHSPSLEGGPSNTGRGMGAFINALHTDLLMPRIEGMNQATQAAIIGGTQATYLHVTPGFGMFPAAIVSHASRSYIRDRETLTQIGGSTGNAALVLRNVGANTALALETQNTAGDAKATINGNGDIYTPTVIYSHKGLRFSTSDLTYDDRGIFVSSGDPEGVITARPGSLCIDVAGGADGIIYYKRSTTGNTGWRGIAIEEVTTTAGRPTHRAGRMVFDTDLGKPVWSDGTNWVDATGTTV